MMIVEANMELKLAEINRTMILHIFMDLMKSYETLDRERFMEKIQGYGVGTSILGIIR